MENKGTGDSQINDSPATLLIILEITVAVLLLNFVFEQCTLQIAMLSNSLPETARSGLYLGDLPKLDSVCRLFHPLFCLLF